ncbi:MAG: lytic transglycosylase domain-containing protein [Acidobacteriota bacterium]
MKARRSSRRFRGWLVVAIAVVASPAAAERIVFTNGRSISVRDYSVHGDTVTVSLREGGQARFSATMVARVEADEVPADLRVEGAGGPEDPPPPVVPRSPASGLEGAQPLGERPFAGLIDAVSRRHDVDPVLVHAVVQVESNYQPRARSHKGARGLMQVLPATGRDLGISNLFDPEANLEAGVRYLKMHLARFPLADALAAYHAGPGAVTRHGGVPPIADTRQYVQRVLANLAR